jgi:hypothetical protein
MRSLGQWTLIATAMVVMLIGAAANAADVTQTKTVGPYRIELNVYPAEPFFTKQEVADKHVQNGMEIEGGAAPVAMDAASHPNHHLVVHVFDKQGGKAETAASVTMRFEPVDSKGKSAGAAQEVPVVIMQAIGKGPQSTHYGNNVTMPAGRYRVTVTVNGKQVVFIISASDAAGPMAPMKM